MGLYILNMLFKATVIGSILTLILNPLLPHPEPHTAGTVFNQSPVVKAQTLTVSATTPATIVDREVSTATSIAELNAQRAAQAAAQAAAQQAAALQQAQAKIATLQPDATGAQAEALKQLAAHGWGADQFSCLNQLWNRESSWRINATNTSSGAYGIPQALPGNKMASAGPDWETNPATQIKWGLKYITDRYGTPCGAWAHSQATNWY